MKKIMPGITVRDIVKSIEFYEDILGFEIIMSSPKGADIPNWVWMKNRDVEIIVQQKMEWIQCAILQITERNWLRLTPPPKFLASLGTSDTLSHCAKLPKKLRRRKKRLRIVLKILAILHPRNRNPILSTGYTRERSE